MSETSEDSRKKRALRLRPKDDVQLSFVSWLLDQKSKLGDVVWRERSLDDLSRTSHLVAFTNAIRDAGLLGLTEPLTSQVIENQVYDFLARLEKKTDLNAIKSMLLSEATKRLRKSHSQLSRSPANVGENGLSKTRRTQLERVENLRRFLLEHHFGKDHATWVSNSPLGLREIGRELNMPLNGVTGSLNALFGRPDKQNGLTTYQQLCDSQSALLHQQLTSFADGLHLLRMHSAQHSSSE